MNVSKMEYVSTIRGLFVVKMRNTYDEHLMKSIGAKSEHLM